jgi:predicted small integral membrane protein
MKIFTQTKSINAYDLWIFGKVLLVNYWFLENIEKNWNGSPNTLILALHIEDPQLMTTQILFIFIFFGITIPPEF